jgi:hypothetical protein
VTRPSVSVRLLARLRTELSAHGLVLPESARCVRQYAPGDRANGAWSWFVEADTEVPDVGSLWPMRAVLAAERWLLLPVVECGREVWHVDVL